MIRSAGYCENYTICSCRPTHVGRGLKSSEVENESYARRRRPTHVGRGLKSPLLRIIPSVQKSPHARGAWIEVM